MPFDGLQPQKPMHACETVDMRAGILHRSSIGLIFGWRQRVPGVCVWSRVLDRELALAQVRLNVCFTWVPSRSIVLINIDLTPVLSPCSEVFTLNLVPAVDLLGWHPHNYGVLLCPDQRRLLSR